MYFTFYNVIATFVCITARNLAAVGSDYHVSHNRLLHHFLLIRQFQYSCKNGDSWSLLPILSISNIKLTSFTNTISKILRACPIVCHMYKKHNLYYTQYNHYLHPQTTILSIKFNELQGNENLRLGIFFVNHVRTHFSTIYICWVFSTD